MRRVPSLGGRLLAGASSLAVAVGAGGAGAQSLAVMRGAGGVSGSAGVPAIALPSGPTAIQLSPTAASAQLRAVANAARATRAADLAMQAQTAARAAAAALAQTVPNGLVAGGLVPVSNPMLAANDPSGLHTWQGASQPVQSGAAATPTVTVTVTQTDPRALLDWQSFNVGRDTTLVFDQKANGVAQPNWIVLNRVVGQLDPSTGLRDPATAPAPSQILGHLKADGTVLVLNANGVLFGPNAQVNTHSLVASSLEIGRALTTGGAVRPLTLGERNGEFLNLGLLGYADQASVDALPQAFTFSAQATSATTYDPEREGAVSVQAGAQIASDDGGYVLLTGPSVENAGTISATNGQVTLQAGRQITLTRSEGATTSADPNVRGFLATSLNRVDAAGSVARNAADGIITSAAGYLSLASTASGAVIDEGVLRSTTTVSRNGYVQLSGQDVRVGPAAAIAVTPDDAAGTIPQDPTSLATFKTSRVAIGGASSRIEIDSALVYAPGGNITIGAPAGALSAVDTTTPATSRIFVDAGAVIDASGLKDVAVDASRNAIKISPVKGNELRDSPLLRGGFLDGATVYVDPRLSGVRADGVAWTGSPLIEAGSYAQQVPVKVSELLTKGGSVTLGVQSFASTDPARAPDIVVKPGATIDVSGGWVRYAGGAVQTTRLINAAGQVVDIGQADPNDTYIGIYTGYTETQSRFGLSQTYNDPVRAGVRVDPAYIEGRDAGVLTVKGSVVALDGAVHADAFAGSLQKLNAQPGTATATAYGDQRTLQAAPSQLPSGGFLYVQAYGRDTSANITGGADVRVVAGAADTSGTANLAFGQTVQVADGVATTPARDAASLLGLDRRDTILLGGDDLSTMGLSQLTLQTSGRLTLDAGAEVTLAAGGVFNGLSGRALTVGGAITAPSGTITLATAQLLNGSALAPDVAGPGSYDLTVTGTLSVAGLWTNDFGATAETLRGSAWQNGGRISLTGAPRVSLYSQVGTLAAAQNGGQGGAPATNVDISGSILVPSGARLDLSSGGYVSQRGALSLAARGGDLTLTQETTYFQLAATTDKGEGQLSGLRLTGDLNGAGVAVAPVNPAAITARVALADGTVFANGFGGGGAFRLTAPSFAFGDAVATSGAQLPLDFFSRAGFASYTIRSFATDLSANPFSNGLGGYSALLKTQTLTVGAGQTLDLTQATLTPFPDAAATAALQGLASGSSVYAVLSPAVPAAAYDRRGVSLTFDGPIELDVAAGGRIEGAAGAALGAGKLDVAGAIRLPGGTVTQGETLPGLYIQSGALAVQSLSQVFSVAADGTIDEAAPNAAGLTGVRPDGTIGLLTNGQVAAANPIYLLGGLSGDRGVRVAAGGAIDLSGTSLLNPRAVSGGVSSPAPITQGRLVAGGVLRTLDPTVNAGTLFQATPGPSVYAATNPTGVRPSQRLDAAGGRIDVSGVAATYDELAADGSYVPTAVWSDAGAVRLGGGATFAGTTFAAQGGAAQARGGELSLPTPTITTGATDTGLDRITPSFVTVSGFDTLVARGGLAGEGDATLTLARALVVTTGVYSGIGQDLNLAATRDALSPTLSATGALTVAAPYIGLLGDFQTLSTPARGAAGGGSLTLKAAQIDVRGAVLLDRSVASARLESTGDLRLTGAAPWQSTFGFDTAGIAPTLRGELVSSGDVTLASAQTYPTTGSSFTISSASAVGVVTFARTTTTAPATPYSAGGSLTVLSESIVQGGVVRAPLGTLAFGSNAETTRTEAGVTSSFAPATDSLQLAAGSVTSVSADGLSIPYGTTTDQTEWFFAPTNAAQLTSAPAAVLRLAADAVAVDAGAGLDLKGGGDLYAYEFVSGVGGSRDVLDRFNADSFSSRNGLQYPDGRQVYAIVPGLSDKPAAVFDPIYSADYALLYAASQVGRRVYLEAAPGLAAGWYTLLPAKYALLPGGLRVVESVGAAAPRPGAATVRNDGTLVVAGRYGDAASGAQDALLRTFEVQTQATFRAESNIALTSANSYFPALAAKAGRAAPASPVDAARLVIAPLSSLSIASVADTTPGAGGRGAQVDIGGQAIAVVTDPVFATPDDGVVLDVASLARLNAASLFIGGERTENADGTTSLAISANRLRVVTSKADPLSAPDILLGVDGPGARLTIAAGSVIEATGTGAPTATGDYVLDGSGDATGLGALVHVSTGPQRALVRVNSDRGRGGDILLGVATLRGNAVMLDASGDLRANARATLTAADLSLASDAITVGAAPSGNSLNLTLDLLAQAAQAQALTLRSSGVVFFEAGSYGFNGLTLDAPGVRGDGGAVAVAAKALTFTNGSGALYGCDFLCRGGTLAVTAQSVTFRAGEVSAADFGGGVSLAAANGVFYAEAGAAFDAGVAPLSIDTPLLVDAANASLLTGRTPIPSLALSTKGALSITHAASGAGSAPAGTPGSALSLSGGQVAIADADLRATAGRLDVTSAGAISVGGAAKLETPGYVKTLGDAADPSTISAPGGALTLKALGGDLRLASGASLDVGGGAGAAGRLTLTATGAVTLDGALGYTAPDGGAAFALDTGGGFDLSAFATRYGSAFGGGVAVRSGQGDLLLASGRTLKAAAVSLTADGGTVEVAGLVDTSGVEGGDVALYAAQAVRLDAGARIDTHAAGYAASDTRRASAGSVTLGVGDAGAITVASGATLDLSASRPADRLVTRVLNGSTTYTYVQGDQGGVLTLRAPVVQAGGVETVPVTFAGSALGAREIALTGVRRFDLGAIADAGALSGVTRRGAIVTLDAGATAAGKANFLADAATGTVADFVQGFDVSASYAALGSLTSDPAFRARPGVNLDYAGSIVLASNWNLGAGVVDVAGATAAGLMAPVPTAPGKSYVLPGADAAVFDGFTRLTFRTGGRVDGAAPTVSLRAGGDLTLQGSVTDGFFTFRDQTDPDYLNLALGGGTRTYQAYLTPGCSGSCAAVGAYRQGVEAPAITVALPGAASLASSLSNPVPYSAAANGAAALGPQAGGAGDPIGSAVLLPRLASGAAADSASFVLVAGADLASAAPARALPGGTANLAVEGDRTYTLAATAPTSSYAGTLAFSVGGTLVQAADLQARFTATNPGLDPNARTVIDFTSAPGPALSVLRRDAQAYFGASGADFEYTGDDPTRPTGVVTTFARASAFLRQVSGDFATIRTAYRTPNSAPFLRSTTVTVRPLVRTGSGAITLAASGDVDIRDGANPTYLTLAGAASNEARGVQVGGAAVYTAGVLAAPGARTVADAAGVLHTVDPGAATAAQGDVFATPPAAGYRYGAGADSSTRGVGYKGVLLANPVLAEGGGALSIQAGRDVLGRQDLYQQRRIDASYDTTVGFGYSWIGTGDQPWRTGTIGAQTTLLINPQLFSEGFGALAGGRISIAAARDASDLTVVSDTSAITARTDAAGVAAAGAPTLWSFGGGDVAVDAGRDVLGGRLDVAAGQGSLRAGRDVAAAGVLVEGLSSEPDALRVRLSDATVSIVAGGDAELRGVTALGVHGATSDPQGSLNARGFYTAVASIGVVADGGVVIDNRGLDVLAPNVAADDATYTAVYPGSLTTAGLNGDLTLSTGVEPQLASSIFLYPSASGELRLLAGAAIAPLVIAMDDGDPGLLPGAYTGFAARPEGLVSGRGFTFPTVLPSTSDIARRALHARIPTHAGDLVPNRVAAGRDITGLILASPKAARVAAGRDIVDVAFFGQNLDAGDITRVTAGRDITATTALVQPIVSVSGALGPRLPAVQGDTFVIGGPGAFFLEAGRDLGPFLTSVTTNGYAQVNGVDQAVGQLTFGGGVQSLGAEWNPWLGPQGADVYVEFGVGKGQDFAALTSAYLDPANVAKLDDALFAQTTDALGRSVADRTRPIYQRSTLDWFTDEAANLLSPYGVDRVTGEVYLTGVAADGVTATRTVVAKLDAGGTATGFDSLPPQVALAARLTLGGSVNAAQADAALAGASDRQLPLIPWLTLHQPDLLRTRYGTLDVSFDQAFAAFSSLSPLAQRTFLLKNVYFNELAQTSIPTSVSYLKYSRGYRAVNTLFPATLGYTANDLNGGGNTGTARVQTGDLDLRLATLQTARGGDLFIAGPGGRVLAGSTVRTSEQAARRAYDGGRLFAGDAVNVLLPAAITSIPVGYEGVLTLRGGGVYGFTDGDLRLNQSRLFSEAGGDVELWSSNGDLNAGQGPKTSANIPPTVVRVDETAFATVDQAGAVSGAGIGSFQSDPTQPAASVFLIAPRGAVDAGDAGVRVSGNLFIAALQVNNANNFSVKGSSSGLTTTTSVSAAVQTSATASSTAAIQAAQQAAGGGADRGDRSVITVNVQGYAADLNVCKPGDDTCKP